MPETVDVRAHRSSSSLIVATVRSSSSLSTRFFTERACFSLSCSRPQAATRLLPMASRSISFYSAARRTCAAVSASAIRIGHRSAGAVRSAIPGDIQQYPAIPSNTQPGSTVSFASGGPLFRTAIVAFVALTTTSAEQVGTSRHDVGSRSIQRMHSTKSGSWIALLTCYIETARGWSPVEANFAPAMHANPAPSVAINSQGLAISDSPANR